MRAILDFVATFPGKYIGKTWKLVNIYGTWVINRSPAGTDIARGYRIEPLLTAAQAALRDGRFSEAAKAYAHILGIAPGQKIALNRVKALDRVRRLRRLLKADPDNTAALKRFVRLSYRLEAYGTTLGLLTQLEEAGFEPRWVAQHRAFCYVRAGRYAQGLMWRTIACGSCGPLCA